MMLILNENGLLIPGGLIDTSLHEVEEAFVFSMPLSSNRSQLFDQLSSYINEVKVIIGETFTYWLDGSFTTSKLNPKDVDIVLFVDYRKHQQFNRELDQLRSVRKPVIDSYFVPVYPSGHRNYRLYELSQTEWLYVFGTTRDYKNKGILSLQVQ
ncbi:DUF6932 family protein [Fibrella aquatica]|jgi:hypothetical protein|uniref:DUF6932 family protein n=1 Tax=Fibrella aquatica TaxID=3242487 RepID=UPI00352131EA